jgi:hypothetical protein
MTAAADITVRAASSDALLETLQPAVQRHLGTSIVAMNRSPSPYSTSFVIEVLELELRNGARLALIFKDLSPRAMLDGARRTRPRFVYDPLREIEVYRTVLSPADLGTARLFAAEVDPAWGRYWLFLEKVEGVELYQVEELDLWMEAARWLRRFHDRFASATAPESLPQRLTRWNAGWYRRWMSRAMKFGSAEARTALERLAAAHPLMVEHLCQQQTSLIHGDFYASNVLIARPDRGWRVCPVDWERASVAPSLFDLAALCMGWREDRVEQLAQAYAGIQVPDMRSLGFCRLQMCIQWLGWSSNWRPPSEHRQDWLSEALALADALEI